jgi:hypothetical protein
MFSGMPATMISTRYKGNLLEPAYHFLFLGKAPASYLVLALASFFLLMLAFGVETRLAVAGALAFGFCAYNFQIMMVGHNSKMVAIALMPAVLAAMVHAFRSSRWTGAALFGVALSFEILANHPQITYYLAIVTLAFGLAEMTRAWRERAMAPFARTAALLVVAALLAAGTNVNHLWPAWEYGKETMRGGSELATGDGTRDGLDKEYATAWSYGIGESLNLLVPNARGGASASFDPASETYRALASSNDPAAGNLYQRLRVYWGPQAFTAGPMYMGAAALFLFLLGLILARGPLRWWVAGVSLLALLLGWGRHVMPLASFFHDHVPLYNKFRVPSMILVILQLTIPLLGFIILDAIFKGRYPRATVARALKIAAGVTGGACLLLAIAPGLAGTFLAAGEEYLPETLRRALASDRESLLRLDAWRSLAFILGAAVVTWAVTAGWLRATRAALLVAAIVVIDAWNIDKRYLNDTHFTSRRELASQYAPRPVDKAILQDKTPAYRVLDLTTDPFNDSHASYHHKSIGGYSAAKLQRYQEMIDHFIAPEVQALARNLSTATTLDDARASLARQKILAMLDTRYVIIDPSSPPLENPAALGPAWFALHHETVATADDEIEALRRVDPATTAITRAGTATIPPLPDPSPGARDTIRLLSHAPDRVTYATSSATTRLALFSEIYYPRGWQATLDGQPVPHFRANYILRAMIIPPGDHAVTFTFRPASYYSGATISAACSSALLLLLACLIAGRLLPPRLLPRLAARRRPPAA